MALPEGAARINKPARKPVLKTLVDLPPQLDRQSSVSRRACNFTSSVFALSAEGRKFR